MMATHEGGNVFAEIARNNVFKERPRVELTGDPGYDNVDVTYIPGQVKPTIFQVKLALIPRFINQ